VYRNVLVPLLKTPVLLDEVQIVTTDDNGSLHLHFANSTSQNSSTDVDEAGKGALLINISSIDSLETK